MPCTLKFTCVPIGISKNAAMGDERAHIHVLVVPSCDADTQIADLMNWGQVLLGCAQRFQLDGIQQPLMLDTANIKPELWRKLLGDAKAGSTPLATPVAPNGVSLSSTHKLAHDFLNSAYSRPIDENNEAPKVGELQRFHSSAIAEHGLYAPYQNQGIPDPPRLQRVLRNITNTEHIQSAKNITNARFVINTPGYSAAYDAVYWNPITTPNYKMIRSPDAAAVPLARLQVHLTNSMRAAAGDQQFAPDADRTPHLLLHVNRLVAAPNQREAAAAKQVAEQVSNRTPYTFNQRITMLMNMPAILEALGLVLRFEIAKSYIANPQQVRLDPACYAVQTLGKLGAPTCYWTYCNSNFLPTPKSAGGSITSEGWMLPSDGYQSGSLQLDSAAMHITNFANQAGLRQIGAASGNNPSPPPVVTVSHDEDVSHPILPPSPQTGGLQVWKDNLQEDIAAKRQAILQNQVKEPFYADDLQNGIVVDVIPDTRGICPNGTEAYKGDWIRLCQRDETFHVDHSTVTAKNVERGVRIAASRSIQPSISTPLAHVVDETIFTWRLGSLVGKPSLATKGIKSGTDAPKPPEGAGIPWKFGAPQIKTRCGDCSPLFGWTYKVSMRASFVTGSVVPFNPFNANTYALRTRPFLRYELMNGPVLIPVTMTENYLPDQKPTRVLVGSKVQPNTLRVEPFSKLSQRLIIPPRVNKEIARRHGQSEKDIATGARILPLNHNGDLPQSISLETPNGSPGDPSYLPDPIVTGVWAILTDLCGNVLAKSSLDYFNGDDAVWPDYAAHVLELHASTDPAPSLTTGPVTRTGNLGTFLRNTSKAFICRIPAGTTYLLMLRPKLDANIGNLHALASIPPARDTSSNCPNPNTLSFSDICRPTTVSLIHATDHPIAKPVINKCTFGSNSCSIDVEVDPQTMSKVALVIAWQESIDDPKKPSFSQPCLRSQLAEVTISKKHDCDKPRDSNKPVVTVTGQLPFSDGRHRYLKVTAIATARYGTVFTNSSDSHTLESEPKVVHLNATMLPHVPDIEYILPNLCWEISDDKRKRTMGLTVVMNRSWFTCGAGEQFAVVTAPSADSATLIDTIGTSFTPNLETRVSAWGVYADWASSIPPGTAEKRIKIQKEAPPNKGSETLPFSPGLADSAQINIGGTSYWALLYTPRYNLQDQQWYVNLSFSAPVVYGTLVRLITARYQQYAQDGKQVSDVGTCDFAFLRPDRAVVITRTGHFFWKKLRIQIIGMSTQSGDSGIPKTVIEVRHFERHFFGPKDFNWTAGQVVTPDEHLPAGVLWQATIHHPFFGGKLVAQEWEIWPDAADTAKAQPIPVYSDIIPI
jgi:hypothetical protein